MTSLLARTLRATACAVVIGGMTSGAAQATEGYFQEGTSVQEKATGGAGVANARDALTIANNPAGLVDVGAQANLDLTFFAPDRGYSTSGGPTFVAPGSNISHDNVFPVPAMAFARPLDATSSFGIAMYGNGGMNTHYVTSAPCGVPGMIGVFCGGSQTGVNLNQAFLSVGYAKKFGTVSVGIAPIFAMQMFSAYGLSFFDNPVSSSNPGEVSGNGTDWSFGGGLRVGAEWHVTPSLRLGLAGSTPIWMTKLSKYSGLLADGGSFDIPASITVGVAYDVLPTFTVMLDYKRIFYTGVPAISNSPFAAAQFGASGGPGFGWRDVDVVAVGAQWQMTPSITLRAGYAHNTNPIRSSDVMLNILAPGVATDHISAGASYALTQNILVDLAGVVVPDHNVSGPDPFGAAGSDINLRMSQFEITAGLTYKFGAPPPAPVVVSKY